MDIFGLEALVIINLQYLHPGNWDPGPVVLGAEQKKKTTFPKKLMRETKKMRETNY